MRIGEVDHLVCYGSAGMPDDVLRKPAKLMRQRGDDFVNATIAFR